MGMRTVKASYGKGVIEYVLQKSRGMVTLILITKEQMNQWGNCIKMGKTVITCIKKKSCERIKEMKENEGFKEYRS